MQEIFRVFKKTRKAGPCTGGEPHLRGGGARRKDKMLDKGVSKPIYTSGSSDSNSVGDYDDNDDEEDEEEDEED